MAKIVLIDDHCLLRMGLAKLLESLGYNVLFEADNGKDFIDQLDINNLPDLVLMDIEMHEMNGYETTLWLKNNYPGVKVLALSMHDKEIEIIRMLKCGAKGYILKDSNPNELNAAIENILANSYYYSNQVSGKLIHSINTIVDDDSELNKLIHLSDKEIEFLKLICTELSYKDIAAKMYLSPRTIDGYRDALFEKLNVKTRVGLAMYAFKNGIVKF